MSQTHQLSARMLALGAALLLLAGCSTTSSPPASSSSSAATTTSSPPTATSSPGASGTTTSGTTTSSPTTSGSTSSSMGPTASAAACTAADALAQALTSFKDSLKTGATVDQVRAARDQVVKTYNELAAAVGDVAKGRLEAVKSAADRFDAAVKDIPDDASLTQAVDSLRQEAKDVQAALSDLLTEVHC